MKNAESAGQAAAPVLDLRGATIRPGFIPPDSQVALLEDLRVIARAAPFMAPITPGGRQMSVRMTSAGRFGWVSRHRWQGYARTQPDGRPWPPIPEAVLAVWHALVPGGRDPECLLVNYYGEGARMGLHQDRDEVDFNWPVVSISLGDEGLFRVGGVKRGGPTGSLWLCSGDVVVLGGAARLAYHGVDRIRFRSSSLLPQGGRVNLTLRVVT